MVLFEAGVAAANGLAWNDALASITIDAARVIGLEKRVGSLEVGKDGDVALFDGDPFEYASHTVGVVIDGKVVLKKGDTLTRIAARQLGDANKWRAIAKLNVKKGHPRSTPKDVVVGELLKLP